MLSDPTPTPINWSQLPRVAREEAKLINALHRYLPPTLAPDTLCSSVEKLISEQLTEEFSFKLERLSTTEAIPYLKTLPKVGLFLVIGLAPLEEKAFCEVDLLFAHSIIDRLLGGEGEPLTMLRPLTEIEQGVFSYLMLKILSHLYEKMGRSARVQFRLQNILASGEELVPLVRPGAMMATLTLQAKMGNRAGSFRLLFPSPFVQQVFLEPTEQFTDAEARFYQQRFQQLGFIHSHLWAELGRTTLKANELQGMKEGDVVLLEATEVAMSEGKLSGYLTLRVGAGEASHFRGQMVSSAGEILKVKLEGEFKEHPLETKL